MAMSDEPGTLAPAVPPEVVDQFAVLVHKPELAAIQ
jgi:hypothetical protein